MAADFKWCEHNGAAVGDPPWGSTQTTGVSQVNWKNTDDVGTAYTASPITAGNNSYVKWQFAAFTGTFNQISNGLFQHVSGALGAGLTLKAQVTTGTYQNTTTDVLTGNLTNTGLITTGWPVKFGGTGPQAAGKAVSSTSNPSYSEYLATQLVTTVAASAGDTATVTVQLRYDEN